MNKSKMHKVLTAILAISLLGCNSSSILSDQEESVDPEVQEEKSSPETSEIDTQDNSEKEDQSNGSLPSVDAEDFGLTDQQRNSVSMLYYLAITAEEIRTSKNNRLILDDIYTTLLNDINPGSIDETTQEHLKNLRDIIKSYLNISVKRERLQYIYNQNKAAAIRSAVPNPLAILSVTNALDWKKLAITAVYTVVDSYTSYKNASDAADQEFLMSGWDLDDEETATIQKNRDRAFDYMVDIVQQYGFDGKLTLNEKAISKFNEICSIESPKQKIKRLESEVDTYQLLGNYWLELADCYYETDQYQKCLDAVQKYNELAMDIYRQDYNYVQILPKAIVAAQVVYRDDKNTYIKEIESLLQDLMKNTSTEDWSVRYFAAQVYLDLYTKTNNQDYMKKAYDIAYDNVTILLDEQLEINKTYLAEVKEVTIDKPDTKFMTDEEKKEAEKEYKAEQKRLKEYNKGLKNARKTELPSLYEPLIVNCDLLFALADELGISDAEKKDIEDILQTEKNGVFLSKPINKHYSFSKVTNEYDITLTTDKIEIPAEQLTNESTIKVTVTESNSSEVFDDCIISAVDRKGDTIDTFIATVTSKKLKSHKWTADSKVKIEIKNGELDTQVFNYKVVEFKKQLIGNKVVFGQE